MAPFFTGLSKNLGGYGFGRQKISTSSNIPIDSQIVYSPILANPLSGSAPNYTVNPDPNSSFLVLALPFVSGGRDSGFGDYSGDIRGTTNRTVSVTDSTSLNTTDSKFYGSCFDTSCKMTVNMSTYATLNGQFCWEFWVRATAFGTFDFFLGKASTDNGKGQGIKFGFGDVYSPYMSYANNDVDIPPTIISAAAETSISTSTWYHCAYTRDSSNVIRFFLNGVPVKSVTDSTTFPASTDFQINNPVYAYTGQLQDMRVYVGTKKYSNSGFSVP